MVYSGPPTKSVPVLSNTISENISYPVNLVPPSLPHLSTSQPTVPLSIPPTSYSITSVPPSTLPPPGLPVTKPSISPSYRLPSVRDIYWPTNNQQEYVVPVSNPAMITSNTLNLPTPIHSTNSSPNSIKQNNLSFNNCDSIVNNDLAATFDGTLGSDDPFNDAELKSLNDVTELRHLYSAIGSANTIRR